MLCAPNFTYTICLTGGKLQSKFLYGLMSGGRLSPSRLNLLCGSRSIMLCSQVKTLCGGFNDRLCEYSFHWYLSTYSFLVFKQNSQQKMSSEFSAWCLELQYFFHWSQLPCPDHHKNQKLMALFSGYSEYLRCLFSEKIRRAAEKPQCVPYFCMLLVWGNCVFQYQRPFGMDYWIAWVSLA